MKRELARSVGLLAIALAAFPGCMLVKRDCKFDQDVAHYETVATEIEYPGVAAPSDDCLVCDREPRSLLDAEPNPQFKIRNVKTRVYRGRCADNGILPDNLAYMVEKKPEMYAIIDSLTGFDDKNRREVTQYLDAFFEIAEDPGKVEKELIANCN